MSGKQTLGTCKDHVTALGGTIRSAGPTRVVKGNKSKVFGFDAPNADLGSYPGVSLADNLLGIR